MSRPHKHPKTHVYYLRKVVPADLRQVLGKTEVKVSLGTKDPTLAKTLHAELAAKVEREWKTLRAKPEALTFQQTVAIAGEWYRELVADWTADPGKALEWATMRDLITDALIDVEREETPQSWQRLADLMRPAPFLLSKGLHLDEPSYRRFLIEAGKALTQAAGVLERFAEGDYRPDSEAGRFPTLAIAKAVSLDDLFTRWRSEATPSASTLTTWTGLIRDLKEHLGARAKDIKAVTPDDIVSWKDAAVARGLSAKTINDSRLGCAKALFGYAVRNRLLSANPCKDVRVVSKPRAGTGMLPYSDDEVGRLLALAKAEEHPARRWLPWLAASSGARVGEVAQLWGNRITTEDGIAVMRLEPAEDGGSLKNRGSERTVPIHPDLIADGFLDFVRSKGAGPLFYKRSSGEDGKRHATKGVSNHLAKWVRDQGFADPRKAPNHAFRHWFKSAASKAGVADSLADALQGHAASTEGGKYRHFDIVAMRDAVASISIPTPKKAETPPA